MAKSSALEKSELNKIIGESYFNLKQYDKAIPYLSQYKTKGNGIILFLSVSYDYKQKKNFESAVSQFNKLLTEKIL
jgi:tetratricopeptide (TPR) repeat protein